MGEDVSKKYDKIMLILMTRVLSKIQIKTNPFKICATLRINNIKL